MAKLKDLTGQRFGRWSVTARAENTNKGQSQWLCVCDCGTVRVINTNNIRQGSSKSCGCLKDELTSARSKTHGLTNTRTYRCWANMITRCENKNFSRHADYADRGISVCDNWQTFAGFLADMGECPSSECSIDRINNDGNYEPSNCRWATKVTQANNTRANNVVTFNGVSRTLAEWSRLTGINYSTLRNRINRSKMPPEIALAHIA